MLFTYCSDAFERHFKVTVESGIMKPYGSIAAPESTVSFYEKIYDAYILHGRVVKSTPFASIVDALVNEKEFSDRDVKVLHRSTVIEVLCGEITLETPQGTIEVHNFSDIIEVSSSTGEILEG